MTDAPHSEPDLPPEAAKPRKRHRLRRLLLWSLLVFLLAGPTMTLLYRFVPPPTTILMLQGAWAGRGLDYRWRPLSRISPALPQAAVAAEDANFCSHNGFELEAMRKAYERNQRAEKRGSSKVRGGSTISQQTAKNVFLWPQRSYVRKGLEATFTVLIEAIWGKRRIMEVYLNVAEFGPGLYGAEAASQRYFGKPAAKLTRAEAARLIAVLPSPRKWRVERPGRYVARRSKAIRGRSGVVGRGGLAACVSG